MKHLKWGQILGDLQITALYSGPPGWNDNIWKKLWICCPAVNVHVLGKTNGCTLTRWHMTEYDTFIVDVL